MMATTRAQKASIYNKSGLFRPLASHCLFHGLERECVLETHSIKMIQQGKHPVGTKTCPELDADLKVQMLIPRRRGVHCTSWPIQNHVTNPYRGLIVVVDAYSKDCADYAAASADACVVPRLIRPSEHWVRQPHCAQAMMRRVSSSPTMLGTPLHTFGTVGKPRE